jgi:fibro-slime domain-containing protein
MFPKFSKFNPNKETKMKGSLKKFALTFFMLAALAVNSYALQCSGTLYVKLPSGWPTSLYLIGGGNFVSIAGTPESGGWTKFNITTSLGGEYQTVFMLGQRNNNNEYSQPVIGRNVFNGSSVNTEGDAGSFTCAQLNAANNNTLYISENPTSEGRTVVSDAPPNAKYFYFLPPKEENWIIGTPYYKYGNNKPIPMLPDDKCGWFKLVYFSENPPDEDGWIWLGSELKADEDQIGVQGVNEDMVDWVGGKPTPFNLFAQFGPSEGEKHLSFKADDGTWNPDAPKQADIDESRCSYNFAAMIYDTDRSQNPSFTLMTEDVGTGSDQYSQWTSGIIQGMVKKDLNPSTKKIECDNCVKGNGTPLSSMGYFLKKEDFDNAFDPESNTNVVVCYDMPFSRTDDGLWEFDSDKMVNNQGKTVGGFFPEILQNRVLATAAGADYSTCPDCDKKYLAESFVNLTDSINPWCFERGFRTRNRTGQTMGSCGAAYGPGNPRGDFSHGDNPAQTWGATPKGGADWRATWRDSVLNLWGRSGDPMVNPFFCFESHAEFTYEEGQEFFFRGDDDIWVYMNNQLVVDLGGAHLAAPGYVNLKDQASKLGLTPGGKYPIDIFFCDRRSGMSNVRIKTNMYFSQNTGLFVDQSKGSVETSDAPICLNKSGGGGCAASAGDGGTSQQCGDKITGNLHYYMQRRNGDRTGLDLDESNQYCNKAGDIITCYGGIIINTANGTVKVDKGRISGGGLSGTYFIYVEAKDPAVWTPTPPPRQVTRFSMASSIFAIWGDIQYESGGAVPNLPAQLRSVRGGSQETLAGKLVPIAFADGAWMGDNAFSVGDAEGLSISISRSGLTNDDGTAEIRIYKDEAGTQPQPLNEPIDIPPSRVLVLWVTGNYEASEEFTYQVNVQGSSQEPHKIKVRLPKLDFVNKGTPPLTQDNVIRRAQAYGSDPARGTSRVERGVYMGEGLDRYIAAFDPADGTLCTTCNNFKVNVNAWVTNENDERIAGGITDNSVLRADAVELDGGVGELSFRGIAEINGPGSNPPYAALSIRGPSTLESTKAFWDGMIFTKPPVPTPIAVEIFDQDGDGKGDLLRIAYDRIFVKTSNDSLPPNKIEVIWDPSKSDTLKFGLGTFEGGRWMLHASKDENWAYWTGGGSDNNFEISLELDSIIVISGKVVDADELGRDIRAAFSDNIKTSKGNGNVVIRNWATFRDKGGEPMTTGFESDIIDKIPAIVVSATFEEGSCGDRSVGPCDDRVVLTLSEPVKKVEGVNDDRGSLPALSAPFQYKLVMNNTNGGQNAPWNSYTSDRDLPVTRNNRSNISWRQSTGQVEPDGKTDSVVTITYRYIGVSNGETNTPQLGDSVKFAFSPNHSLTDLAGNIPNPNERGREFSGEIGTKTDKVPIGEVNPDNTLEDIVNEIVNRNPNLAVIKDKLFQGGVTEILPIRRDWDARKVQEQYPGTVGIMIMPTKGKYGDANASDITFSLDAFYHTNLGNYVVESPKVEVSCADPRFGGDCRGNDVGIYLAWNMRDAKDRWVGTGAYVEVYDFHTKVKGSPNLDTRTRKIEMLGVKRTKKK